MIGFHDLRSTYESKVISISEGFHTSFNKIKKRDWDIKAIVRPIIDTIGVFFLIVSYSIASTIHMAPTPLNLVVCIVCASLAFAILKPSKEKSTSSTPSSRENSENETGNLESQEANPVTVDTPTSQQTDSPTPQPTDNSTPQQTDSSTFQEKKENLAHSTN